MVCSRTVVFLTLLGAVTGMGFFDRPDEALEVLTTPRLVSYSNSDWRRHKRSVAIVPDHITIRLNIGDEVVDLWVTRSEDNTLNVQHHHVMDQPQEDFPHRNAELYSNGTTKSVLVVQHPDAQADNVKVTGSFQHGSGVYHIQPLDSSFNISGDFRHTVWTYDNDAKHGETMSMQAPEKLHRSKRNAMSMRVENTIELFAVVDYSDYIEYTTRYQANEVAAKEMITSNLAYSVESANIRMQSMRTQLRDAVVRLCLVGVMVLTDPTSSSFSETNAIGNILNEASTIAAFRRFITDNQQRLPKADHFLAVTSYQLSGHSDLLAKEARIGSMCSADSITLVRDKRGGINGVSIAHGLGHSLGARDDEDYSLRSCSAEYTMARHQTPLDILANKAHRFQFSSCSAGDINTKMSSSGMACLKRVDVPSAKIVPGVTQEADFFNPEQVCFNELGRASDFCRDFYSFDVFADDCYNAICSVGIFCRVPFTSMCRSVPSFERLSCGNGKWCIGTECVADSRARATNGDEVVAYDKVNFPCDRRFCQTFTQNLGILYNTNCPLTCPRGTFTCPNVFNIQFPP